MGATGREHASAGAGCPVVIARTLHSPSQATPQRPARRPGGSELLLAAAVAVALSGCSQADPPLSKPISDHEPPGQVNVSQDEAALLVMGELVRIYGLEADAYASESIFTIGAYEGAPAWRADVVANVEIDGVRQEQAWTMWIGVEDGNPALLAAHER